MNTCTIETGLFHKKPCGHAAVAHCLNCEQPLCVKHAIAQLTEAGQKTGKFMCEDCTAAAKDYAKSMAAVARSQQEKKLAALDKTTREQMAAPPTPKTPAAGAPHAPAEPAPAEKPKESGPLEFTPKDGKSSYTRKQDEPGYKPE